MNQAAVFEVSLERNQGLIVKATESLTHAESVLQLPFASNCMNWVLGHMAVYRDTLLGCTRQRLCLSSPRARTLCSRRGAYQARERDSSPRAAAGGVGGQL